MKKSVIYLIIFLLGFGFNILGAEETEPSDTIKGYFEALKDGDTEAMKRYIAGKFYEQNRVLLEENTEYPEFLRNFYQGTTLEVADSDGSGKDVILDMKINFPDGNTSVNKLRLKKNENSEWRIVEEIINY